MPEIKLQIAAVLVALNSIEDNYQVRDEGLVNFRMQKVALQAIVDAPDAVPVVQTVVGDDKLDAIKVMLGSLQDAVATVVVNTKPATAPVIPAP